MKIRRLENFKFLVLNLKWHIESDITSRNKDERKLLADTMIQINKILGWCEKLEKEKKK